MSTEASRDPLTIPGGPGAPGAKRARVSWRARGFRYWMILPAVAVILLIGLFPVIYTAMKSVQNITMFDMDTSYNGFIHYEALLHDTRFWKALGHTLIFVAIALPVEFLLGLAMAYLFVDRMPGRPIFVTLLVLPVLVSPIVAGATWRLLFDNRYGPINQVLGWITGEEVTLLWTVDPNLVYPAILIAEVWQWTPFMFLLLWAALSNVDQSQIEAAELDGASWWRTFRLIVMPAIWPVVAIAVLIRALDLFRLFDVVWALTKGGPGTMTETISIYAYVQGFQQFETSYTAAMAFMIIVILAVTVTIILRNIEIDR